MLQIYNNYTTDANNIGNKSQKIKNKLSKVLHLREMCIIFVVVFQTQKHRLIMATMKVKVEKRKVGFGTDKKEMYVSRADRGSVYDIDDISHQVSLESGVNKHQFKAAVGALVDAMIMYLKGGHGISLKGFGTFLPEVKSQSSENPDEVGVKRLRVSFRPHQALYEAVSDINYVTDNEYATEDANDNEGGSTDNGGDDNGGGGQDFT